MTTTMITQDGTRLATSADGTRIAYFRRWP